MRTATWLVLLVCLLLVPLVSAQNASAHTLVTTVEGITEYRLANGLRVLLFPDATKSTVTVNATYLVGSRHEGYGESGMAHLLEHMVFKGTTKIADPIAELRNHGAQFNGSTSADRTNYFETMPGTEENLRWAVEFEADRMVNSRVSRADLDSEMTVVRNEFEAGENNPGRVLQQRVMASAYEWHAYGRSTIGSRSDIENVPIERLQAFYRNYYQPDNAILAITGKFDPARTLGWVQETFGAIPRPSRALQPTYTAEPVQDGEREVVLRRVGDNQLVMMVFHIPAAAHEDMAALDVLARVLGDNASGRLYAALVESKKAVGASANAGSRHDPGVLQLTATLRDEQSLEDVEATMLSVIGGVIQEPPSTEEVDRARALLLRNIELQLADSTRVGLILSESAAAGDWRLLFSSRDSLNQVTPEDVARVARQYLKPSNRTIGRFIPTEAPDRSEIPPAPNLVSKLEGYTGRTDIQLGEDFDPTAANIEARIVRATLPTGLKLILLPKKNRGGTVQAAVNLHFGNLENLRGRSMAAQFAGGLLMRGTMQHTRQQLQDELAKLKAQLNASGGATGASAQVQTVRDSLIPALRLTAEVLRQPSFPESEMDQIRQQRLAAIENARSEPAAQASLALSRHMAPYPAGDPRASLTIDETVAELQAVTLDAVKQFYSDFYGASNGEIAVVGDFDPAEVQSVLAELFGDWKSPAAYSQVKRDWSLLNAVDHVFETPDKANAVVMAVTTLKIDDDHPDFIKLWLANNVFGSNPKSRLFQRIRQRDGLSYGVNTGYSAGTNEEFGMLVFQAISNPENAARVEAAFREELAKAVTEGFTAQEVEEVKATFLQDNLVQRSQDAFLASTMARYEQHGRTMQRLDEILDQVRAATPESVNEAFRQWIKPESFSFFKAGDFAKTREN